MFSLKENQLLKDRRKNVRKRSSQGENGSPTIPSIITNQNRASGHDTRTVKLVLVDSQNIQKLGGGKGSLKRNVNLGVIRNNNKGDSTAMKPARQRRKPGDYLLELILSFEDVILGFYINSILYFPPFTIHTFYVIHEFALMLF